MFAYSVGDALFDPVVKGAVTSLARPAYRAGVVNALYALKRLAQTISPAAFGLVLALSGFRALFVLAGTIVLGYLCVFGLFFSRSRVSASGNRSPRK